MFRSITLPSPDELTAGLAKWIEDHEDEAWSDNDFDLVQGVACDVAQ